MGAPTLNFFYKNNTLSTVQTDNDHHVIVSANAHNLSETTRLEARLLATDVQQSTVTVASENRTAFAYGPYGHDDRHSDARVISRFTGQPWLPSAVGYMLGNGHRLFSPAMMRFYSADSLSPFEAGGLNAYAYCNNDPVNRSDPSGRYSIFKLLRGGYRPKTIIKNMMKEEPRLTQREYRIAEQYITAQNTKADRELGNYQTHYQSKGMERVKITSSLDHRLKSLTPHKPKGRKTRYVNPDSLIPWETLAERFEVLKKAHGAADEKVPDVLIAPAGPFMTLPRRNAFSRNYLAFTGNYIDEDVNALRAS
ncbi:RHS repeat-associated core domain-containing protein [Pseudomonas alabamensis]|uniref:RHS repeat-associated core domain-containing protein n=1 Tax=Pseudomonas alabamensis TaxID=3064349 RepID=UPI0021D7F0E8|nr:RHS repeat-associated core domain-containing protein [Pseudomonas entomophila]